MNVGDLIRQLQQFPPEFPVCVYDEGEPEAHEILAAEESESDGVLWTDSACDGSHGGTERPTVQLRIKTTH